jgi:hypothetical protein
MPWEINPQPNRRTPDEQMAYSQGFQAGVGCACDRIEAGMGLGDLLRLAAFMLDAATDDNE